MTHGENPFEDPEVAEEMRKRGIVHKPGMAAELMEEIAPLLKAEGIDLDDPEAEFDLDTLNTAMSRAVEQHNLSLFTPVASEREQVEQLLTEFAEASTAKNLRAAEAILDSVEPEPTAHRPAASHVIGASLGLLDTWYTDAEVRQALSEVPVPKWRGPARSIARRLIRAGRSGEAFALLDELIARHGGLLVFHAGALAVAGTIHAVANARKTTVPDAFGYLLELSGSRPSGPLGEAFGLADGSAPDLFEEFEEWLLATGDAVEFADVQTRMLENAFEMAEVLEFDLRHPSGVLDFALRMESWDDEEIAESVLATLDNYLHFQIEVAENPAPWEEAHAEVGELALAFSRDAQEVSDVLAAVDALSESERRRALNDTRIVQGVFPLLEWLGNGKATTPAGGVRRAEIATVAGMIGVAARGVAAPAAQTETLDLGLADEAIEARSPVRAVNSTRDVPELYAWWEALQHAEIIERDRSRIRPGEHAEEFTHDELPPLETSEMLASTFISELLAHELGPRRTMLSSMVVLLVAEKLRAAVAGRPPEEHVDLSQWQEEIAPRVAALLQMLESAGLVHVRGGEIEVPPALRGVVLKGAIMGLMILNEDDVVDE